MTPEDAAAGIAATTTYAGLKVTAVLHANQYPKGEEVSGQRMQYLEQRILDRGAAVHNPSPGIVEPMPGHA